MSTVPLRYLGSKVCLASWLAELLPPYQVYVEPFGGSAAVLLGKGRSPIEVYNDADSAVVTFFRCLRDQPDALARAVALTPFSLEEFTAAELAEHLPPLELARRFLIRSWQGRNPLAEGKLTGWRRQKTAEGGHRAHIAARRWAQLPGALLSTAQRLQGVAIEHGDALELLRRYDTPETLFYVDPPYRQVTRSSPRQCRYRKELDDAGHRELLATLRSLQGRVVLSAYDDELYESEMEGWSRLQREVRDDVGQARLEQVWMNPAARAASAQLTLPLPMMRAQGGAS